MRKTKNNLLTHSLSLLLAIVILLSLSTTQVFAAESTAYEKLEALLNEICAMDSDDYTKESWKAVQEIVDVIERPVSSKNITDQLADTVYSDLEKAVQTLIPKSQQATVDEGTDKGAIVNDVKEETEDIVNKTDLLSKLKEARGINTDLYTNDSIAALNNAIDAAQLIVGNDESSQGQVDEQIKILIDAMENLNLNDSNNLDINNLPDGKYTLSAQMIKTDRHSFSMSNNAINHNVWLEVVNGEYYLTIQFKGLTIQNKFGYLMDLYYYDAGYTYNEFGIPQGSLVPVDVLTTQKNVDGTDVIDQFNNVNHLYPELIRFQLVDKAFVEYVPLQVFVPIMESIADGTGTQNVLMQLNWSLLKVDDGSIQPDQPVKQSPAVDLVDPSTGIKVHASNGVFEEGVQLGVKTITTGVAYESAALSLNEVGKKFRLYEIRFLDSNGNETQPNGTVEISYPIPEGYNSANLALYRLNEDGSKTLVRGDTVGGIYTIVARNGARYALVEKGSTLTDIQNSQSISVPKTGDAPIAYVLLALITAGICATIFLGKKRNVQ